MIRQYRSVFIFDVSILDHASLHEAQQRSQQSSHGRLLHKLLYRESFLGYRQRIFLRGCRRQLSRGFTASSSRSARNSSTNLSPSPSLWLSYQAAISITSFFASGRETTCQFTVSFLIGDVPLTFQGAVMMWDHCGGLPNVIPRGSHRPWIGEDHPTLSPAG